MRCADLLGRLCWAEHSRGEDGGTRTCMHSGGVYTVALP